MIRVRVLKDACSEWEVWIGWEDADPHADFSFCVAADADKTTAIEDARRELVRCLGELTLGEPILEVQR